MRTVMYPNTKYLVFYKRVTQSTTWWHYVSQA